MDPYHHRYPHNHYIIAKSQITVVVERSRISMGNELQCKGSAKDATVKRSSKEEEEAEEEEKEDDEEAK